VPLPLSYRAGSDLLPRRSEISASWDFSKLAGPFGCQSNPTAWERRVPVGQTMSEYIRIKHRPTGLLLAEGPLGWGITPFEGNYYISKKYLRRGVFKPNFIPGICPYKFLYVWMDLSIEEGAGRKISDGYTGCPTLFSLLFGFESPCRARIRHW
jgi:hypothetical protein